MKPSTPSLQQRLESRHLDVIVGIGVGHQDGVAARLQRVLDPADDRREDGAHQIRDDHPKPSSIDSACHRVGHVAELEGRTLDSLERFDFELVAGLGIEGPGRRRFVHLRELRNVIDRHPSWHPAVLAVGESSVTRTPMVRRPAYGRLLGVHLATDCNASGVTGRMGVRGMAKTDRSRHLREIASAYLERVVSH
jgi:hypothetical protein